MAVNGYRASNGVNENHTSNSDSSYPVAFPALPSPMKMMYKPGQMYSYRSKLLKRPVPPLQQTLKKYLKSLEPLLTAEELEKTKGVVADFGKPGGTGEKLQEILVERAKTHNNWLMDWWLKDKYLAERWPIAIRGNAAACFTKQPSGNREEYLQTTARFLIGYTKLLQLVYTEALPPDVLGGTPMCMAQYKRLYGYRRPGPKTDSAWHTPPGPESKHIIIFRKGHMYKMDVLVETSTGELDMVPPSHMIEVLGQILDDAKDPAEYPVGILTAETRDSWYKNREKLVKDLTNQKTILCLEKAFMVFCLDEAHPHLDSAETFSDAQTTLALLNCFHGNGIHFNGCNRWYDHAGQIICSEDGVFGAAMEHSNADGPTGAYSCVFIDAWKMPNKAKYNVLLEKSPNIDSASLKAAEKLTWTVTPETSKAIETAKVNTEIFIKKTDLQLFTFSDFGKNFPKSMKVSPDAFMQLAIQLSYYKLNGKLVAMENFAASRCFHEGRIDIIRSTTSASLAFVEAMVGKGVPTETKALTLAAAVKANMDNTKDARFGQGIDEHLLGLLMAAERAGMDEPELFFDAGYTKSTKFILDTSQLPFGALENFSVFSPLIYDGYGINYNPLEEKFLLSVCSFKDCPDTDSMVFGHTVIDSLREMRDMLLAVKVAQ